MKVGNFLNFKNQYMKKQLFFIVVIITIISLMSCENQNWDFPDYKYSTTYFSYQYPIRTIELGDDYVFDNSRDKELKVSIGAIIGGMYENDKDINVEYEIDQTLSRNLFTDTGDSLFILPTSYYTISPIGSFVIPKGKKYGTIEIQLNESFLNDPKSHLNRYVLPVRIIKSQTDSVLRGKAKISNPDRRIADNWDIFPKDFTIYLIKFINDYHGNYLLRGLDVVKNSNDVVIDNVIYRNKYVEKSEVAKLTTLSMSKVLYNSNLRSSTGNLGTFNAVLNFNTDGACTVSEAPGNAFLINGVGRFIKDGDEWGGIKRNMIVLDYSFSTPSSIVLDKTINNNDATIAYFGTWTHNAENGNYLSDRSYSSTIGSYFEVSFTGKKISVFGKKGAYGTFDVYIDNMTTPIATNVSAAAGSVLYKQKFWESPLLSNGTHKLKCVIKQSVNVLFDYFEIYKEIEAQKHFVKDTLVVRDRDMRLETFKPIVK